MYRKFLSQNNISMVGYALSLNCVMRIGGISSTLTRYEEICVLGQGTNL